MRRIDRLPDIHPLDTDRLDDLRAADPGLPDLAWHIITEYRPRLSETQWSAVREFVIITVLITKPRTHENTRRLMTMTTLYVAWVWTVTGCELTPERVFTNHMVRRYLADSLHHHSEVYRFDTVRQIATIAASCGCPEIDRLVTPNQSKRTAPHTPSEIATMHSWAASLPTDLTRQNGRALLGLAGGAGLNAAELMQVQVPDVEFVDGRLFVTVRGASTRRVPVLAGWAKTLAKSIGSRTTGNVFHAYRWPEYPPRALQAFLSDYPCQVRPSASRLHSSWIVTQLNAALPLDILMEISGFTSAQSFQPYLPFTTRHQLNEFIGRIVGEEVA